MKLTCGHERVGAGVIYLPKGKPPEVYCSVTCGLLFRDSLKSKGYKGKKKPAAPPGRLK